MVLVSALVRAFIIVGASVGCLLIAFASFGMDLNAFWDPPALLIVAGPALIYFLVQGPIGLVLADFFTPDDKVEESRGAAIPVTVAALQGAARLSLAMGVVGSIGGQVALLYHLDDPTLIGPNMAVSLLSAAYGLVLSEVVLRPLATFLGGGKAAGSAEAHPAEGAGRFAPLFLLMIPTLGFWVLLTGLK